uniref:Uncharacterized protein n=1 Tax=Avena sativa TaxID=4498 RepID=A0ACD5V6E9_AVESA
MAARRGPKSRKPSQSGSPAGPWYMTGQRPPAPEPVAYAQHGSCDLDGSTERLRTYIRAELLPAFPFKDARFSSLPSSDGVDRISLLPDELLSNIVSRLYVTEAAGTALLASRWRRVWHSAPLVLSDAYISPIRRGSRSTAAAVSYILEAHPGPFRCVHLVSSRMGSRQAQLARWIELLAAKGVQELVLVNRPLPLDVPLPATLFGITTLTRLYISLWKFPDVARLPRGTSFPHLLELGICSVVMEDGDIEAVVARSPVLEILNIQGSNNGLRLRLVSQSIRCVQICGSVLENITVVKAPQLDRLILEAPRGNTGGLCTRIIIGDAPKLHALGILKPGNHIVETRGIVSGIKASPTTMVTSVKTLSLNVRFGNHDDVKMVPSFLRCFPNLEKLHIISGKCDFEAGSARLNLKFWESARPTENVKSCIKVFSFREFRGEIGEVAFIKFFFRNARVLENASIVTANPSFTPFCTNEAFSKASKASDKASSKSDLHMVLLGSTGPDGGRLWSFRKGADYTFDDPFSAVQVLVKKTGE